MILDGFAPSRLRDLTCLFCSIFLLIFTPSLWLRYEASDGHRNTKINTYYAGFFVLGWLLEKEKKMKRIYPSKFGQYYSTKDERAPRTPWLLIAAIFYVIILAGVVGLVLAGIVGGG